MAFDFKGMFNNVAAKVDSAAKTAAKKTGEVAESAKLTISLKTEQAKLEGMFTALGKLCYAQTTGEDTSADLAAKVLEIDTQKKTIADLKAVIAENAGKAYCPACGKEIDIEAAFCPACGTKQEKKKLTEDAPAAKTAPAEEAPKEAKEIAVKPLDAAEFIAFFKATMEKYFA